MVRLATTARARNEQLSRVLHSRRKGQAIMSIEGKAQLLPDDPPRLAVSFGPVAATEPNYFVIHVDENYQHAVVGTPDRKSLWILVRHVPVAEKTLETLTAIARQAGFDTEKLIVHRWKKAS